MPALKSSPRAARRAPKRKLSSVARWGWRAGKAALVLGAIGAGFFAWRAGKVAEAGLWIETNAVDLAASSGFRVAEVEVIGRDRTERDALLAAVGLKRGDPILAFSPDDMRRRIEALPWVAHAVVERRLPDTVAVQLFERKPIALWQHNERFSLIDADGFDLGEVTLEAAPPLPLVVGGDAPKHTADLLAMLDEHPELSKLVQASSWIGDRRWDLKLYNGIDVQLPEENAAEALRRLTEAEAATRLFDKDISAIDLRLPGRMIVRLTRETTVLKARPQQRI